MAIETEIASNKIKQNNNIKFKYEAPKSINEITTNYKHNSPVIVFGGKMADNIKPNS